MNLGSLPLKVDKQSKTKQYSFLCQDCVIHFFFLTFHMNPVNFGLKAAPPMVWERRRCCRVNPPTNRFLCRRAFFWALRAVLGRVILLSFRGHYNTKSQTICTRAVDIQHRGVPTVPNTSCKKHEEATRGFCCSVIKPSGVRSHAYNIRPCPACIPSASSCSPRSP